MKKNTVKGFLGVAVMLLASLGFVGSAVAQTADATIEIKQWKVGFIVGVGGGGGTVKYMGKSYPISIKGLRVGATVGIASADMVGDVFNLKTIKDIEGTYTAAQAAIAIAGGKKVWTLKNQNGVELKLSGTQIGVELALDVGGMELKLK